MECKYCKAGNRDEALYCGDCGRRIRLITPFQGKVLLAVFIALIIAVVLYRPVKNHIQYNNLTAEGLKSLESGNWAQAVDSCSSALKIKPAGEKAKNCAASASARWREQLMQKGRELILQNKYADALSALNKAKDLGAGADVTTLISEVKPKAEAEAKAKAEAAAAKAKELARTGIEWVSIPGGTFMMGDEEWSDSKPVHRVAIASFQMAKTEVTVEQYALCVKAGACSEPDTGDKCNWGEAGREKDPVNCVDWHQASGFAKWAGGRLPAEAEWEYAARGGTTTKWSFGNDESKLGEYAWYRENSGGQTHPVGEKKPNPYGLYDMHGNVWEWCSDWYGENYYSKSPERNPKGPESGTGRVLRGGSWNYYDVITRSGFRDRVIPDNRYNYYGFRCVASR